MKPITLNEIAKSCDGKLFADGSLRIKSIVTDSREVENGSLFAAIKGKRVDGHDFISKCKESGAVCILCEKAPDIDIPYILVDSTLVALKQIAKYYRSMFSIPFIGITGSVGKTSTKEMISAVLSQKFDVHKTQGNFNNELGVPLTIFKLEEHHEIAVIEMGISDFSEMSRLADIVRPDIAVITNIGYCHLENLIDRDGVLKAKTEMLDYLSDNAKIYLNGDDDKLITIKNHGGVTPIFFGLSDKNDYYAENIVNNLTQGVNCTMCCRGEKFDVTVPALGDHMVANALCAAAVAQGLSLTIDEIKKGIESYKTVGSRSNIINTESITIIDDCYNANPTSVKASINALSGFSSRKVAIIGDMKELGKNEKELHFELGKFIFNKHIDVLVAVGELSKHLAKGYENSIHFDTIDECCEKIEDIINKGDTVLIKASHSMHFEKIVEKLKSV